MLLGSFCNHLSDTINVKQLRRKTKLIDFSIQSHDFSIYRIWNTVLPKFPIIFTIVIKTLSN